jgi:SAM-dependent methyltransferase
MDEQTWHAHRTSFGAVAGAYEQGRPDYPTAALEWIAGPTPLRVLDLGAGTGKLTRQLVAAGHEVVAVEPLADMRAALAAAAPGAMTLDGAAEAIPLSDASVDLVVAGQAYHWFVPERAHPEIARVLRPGGRFGVLWNLRDDSEPWVAALNTLLVLDDSASASAAGEPPAVAPYFEPVEGRRFRHEQVLDLDRLIALVASRSYVITLPEPERAALLADVAELTRRHPDLAGRPTFTMPYVTQAYRTTRA